MGDCLPRGIRPSFILLNLIASELMPMKWNES